MVHRPSPLSVVAPHAGSKLSVVLDDTETDIPLPEPERPEWLPQDFHADGNDNDMPLKAEQSAPLEGHSASVTSPSAPDAQGGSKMVADDIFARGDPKRFSFLLSELASEYCMASGVPPESSQMVRQFSMHSSILSSSTSMMDLSGPGMRWHKQRSTNRKDSGEGKATAAKWENLTRNIIQMQSSSVHDVRDFWQYKSWAGQGSHSLSYNRDSTEEMKAIQSMVNQKDAVYLMWTKRSAAWIHRTRERSFRGSIRRSMLILHPDSIQHLLWALLGMAFLMLDIFFLTMSVFDIERSDYFVLADCTYWTLDLLFNFRLGYREQDETVMSFPKIAKRYLRTWFSFDLLLMAAGWLFAFIGSVSGPGTRLVRYIRLVRLTRLIRMSRFARSLHELSFRFQSDMGTLFYKVVMYMIVVGFWIHLSACFFYWIGDNKEAWETLSGRDMTPQLSYIVAVHWAASQLQGSADVGPSFDLWERIFVVVNVLGSIAVLALVVSKITTLLGAIQAEQYERNLIFNTARRFADSNGVRAEVLLEVYRYLTKRRRYQAREKETAAEAELFSHLPFQLRRRLLEEARWPQLKNKLVFLAFGHVSKQFQTQLICDVLQTAVHLPDHLVFQYGSICSRLYLMTSGDGHYTRYAKTFAALLSGESAITAGLAREVNPDAEGSMEVESSTSSPAAFQMFEDRHRQLQGGHVGPGCMLAEFSLWCPWLHKGDLEATGELTLFTINVVAFGELVCHFSSVQQHFRPHAHRVLAFLRSLEELSDLNCSEHVLADLTGKYKRSRSNNLFGTGRLSR